MKSSRFSILSFLLLILGTMQPGGFAPLYAQINTNVSRSQTQNKPTGNDLDGLRQKGFGFLKTGNWEQANAVFERILAETPNDYLSLYGSGLALFNLRRVSEADANVRRAIDILSGNNANDAVLADSLVLSAVISATQNKNGAAIEKLEKAVKLAPENFDANFSLGRAYFGNGDFVNSAKFFARSAEIQPKNLQAKFFLATTLERAGNLQEALKQYRAVVKLDENYAEGNLGLGVLLINLEGDKSAEGLKALQKAISINGNLYEARLALGKTLVKLNRSEEAVEHLKKAAELVPNNPEPHYQLALAYRKIGKKAEAEAETEIVKKIHETRRGVSDNQ